MKKPIHRNHYKRLPKVPTAYELNCKARKAYESEFEDRFKKYSSLADECIGSTNLTIAVIELCLGAMAIVYGIFFDFTYSLTIITMILALIILLFCHKDNKIHNIFRQRMKNKYVEEKMKNFTK
jgi:hypothetical protein